MILSRPSQDTTIVPRQTSQYACTRCRRLKKKCSKQAPKCSNCLKQNEYCEYVDRKNKRKPLEHDPNVLETASFSPETETQTDSSSPKLTYHARSIRDSDHPPYKSSKTEMNMLTGTRTLPPPLSSHHQQQLSGSAPSPSNSLTNEGNRSLNSYLPPIFSKHPDQHTHGDSTTDSSNNFSLPPNNFARHGNMYYPTVEENSAVNSLYNLQQQSSTRAYPSSISSDSRLQQQQQQQRQQQHLLHNEHLQSHTQTKSHRSKSDVIFHKAPSPHIVDTSIQQPKFLPFPQQLQQHSISQAQMLPPLSQQQSQPQFHPLPNKLGVSIQSILSDSTPMARTSSSNSSNHRNSFVNVNAYNNNSGNGADLNATTAPSLSSRTDNSNFNSADKVQEKQQRQENGSPPDQAMDMIHYTLLHTILGSQTPSPPLAPLTINRELGMTFIKAYLDHNHKTYPFLDEKKFLAQVDSIDFDTFFDTRNNGLAPSFTFEVNMIMAIGCTTLERAGIIEKSKGYSKYFSSNSLSLVSTAVSFKDISSVRALILLGVYSFFDPKGVYSWSIVGILTRLAVSIGINRRVREIEARRMSVVDIEMRHRLFWAVFNMDRLISISFGRPVAIQDDDINVPLPEALGDYELESLRTTKNIIEMRRIEGVILTNVHCVRATEKFDTEESRNKVLISLRQDIEKWYDNSRTLSSKSSLKSGQNISFLESTAWFSARYYHLLMLLYRPSYLFPTPSISHLEILGKACLQNLSFTYNLYTSKLLPLNWITLYRFLTTCTTILYCLCQWSIDLVESKTDIHLCVEILDGFSENWYFAKRCSDVFKAINDAILEISLYGSNGRIQPVDMLLTDLMGASSSYHEILFDNSVDIWYDEGFLSGLNPRGTQSSSSSSNSSNNTNESNNSGSTSPSTATNPNSSDPVSATTGTAKYNLGAAAASTSVSSNGVESVTRDNNSQSAS